MKPKITSRLQGHGGAPGEQREYVDVLTSAARSPVRVADDLLDDSQLESLST